MMKKYIGIVLSMVLAGAVHAQGFSPGDFPGPGPGWGGGLPLQGLLEDLDLTATQQQQVKQILDANKTALRSAQLAVLEAQKALDDAVASNSSSQTTISAAGATLGSALSQLAVARAKVEAQISAILTAAQKQTLVEERQRLDDRLAKLIQRLSASN